MLEKTQKSEQTVTVPLTQLHPFPDHPFSVIEDMAMADLVESVRESGVLTPAIVRPREEGGYEVVSGHRRLFAARKAGLETMPVIVREMTRDEAIIIMVDSNLQRESILPSERAKAYKMKLEAIKRQAGRPAKESMVDEKRMAITPAVELSYLTPEEQKLLLDTIDSEQATPSLSQAQRLKKLSQEGRLNDDTMLDIMAEQKKPERRDITLTDEKLRRYFPRTFTPAQIESTIFKLLDAWHHRRQHTQSR